MLNGKPTLKQALEENEFAVTVEMNPPKGTNVGDMLEVAKTVLGSVHGINVTDNTAAVMRAGSLAVCRLLYEQGHDPVMQVTCRDRNRISIQSDLLGGHLLGIRNVLCLTGDSPSVGDHKEAKPVYDLDSVQVMETVNQLNSGWDLAGKPLDGSTEFFIGGAVAPEADSLDIMHQKYAAKVKAGAKFFQTQAIFCPDKFHLFMKEARCHEGKVLGGILVLQSTRMAEYLNANIPGVKVPDSILEEFREAGESHEQELGIEIAARTIRAIRPYCDGVHIMSMKVMRRLPEILKKAELF